MAYATEIPEQLHQYTIKGIGSDFGTQLGSLLIHAPYFKSTQFLLGCRFLTLYPPQAVRQVVLAVHRLVAGGDVAEVAGLLHAVGRREGFEGKQAVVAVNLRRNICQKQKPFCWFLKNK